MDLPEPKG